MKGILNLDETPSSLDQYFKAATKIKHELPTDIEMDISHTKLSCIAETICVEP